jgi:hypothetical protein
VLRAGGAMLPGPVSLTLTHNSTKNFQVILATYMITLLWNRMIFVLFQILILSNKKFCVQKGLLKFYA